MCWVSTGSRVGPPLIDVLGPALDSHVALHWLDDALGPPLADVFGPPSVVVFGNPLENIMILPLVDVIVPLLAKRLLCHWNLFIRINSI